MAQNFYGWNLDEAMIGTVLSKFVNTATDLEKAEAEGDKDKIQELKNIGREFEFFRDSFGLIDYVEKRKTRAQLKSALLRCDISTGFLVDWDDIPLKTESGEKLNKGFPGYEAALTFIMHRLRVYAFLKEDKVKEHKFKDKDKEDKVKDKVKEEKGKDKVKEEKGKDKVKGEKVKDKVKEEKDKEKVNAETVRAEARRLLKESRLILERRIGYKSVTGNEIDDHHKYVIELWEFL